MRRSKAMQFRAKQGQIRAQRAILALVLAAKCKACRAGFRFCRCALAAATRFRRVRGDSHVPEFLLCERAMLDVQCA